MAPGSSPATQFGGKTRLLSARGPISPPSPVEVGGAGRGWAAAPFSLPPSSPPLAHPSWIFCWCRLRNPTPGFSDNHHFPCYSLQRLEDFSRLQWSLILKSSPSTRLHLGAPKTLHLLALGFLGNPALSLGPSHSSSPFWGLHGQNHPVPSFHPQLRRRLHQEISPTITPFAFIFQTPMASGIPGAGERAGGGFHQILPTLL